VPHKARFGALFPFLNLLLWCLAAPAAQPRRRRTLARWLHVYKKVFQTGFPRAPPLAPAIGVFLASPGLRDTES
jgi:hypothetical protein